MKTFYCKCGAQTFFENSQCMTCLSELGWCPGCNTLRSIQKDNSGQYYCSHTACGKLLSKCDNYAHAHVCNRTRLTDTITQGEQILCDYCRFNDTIPDLSIAGNREKWHRIEIAKRRLLYTLDFLGLPYGSSSDGVQPPLSFDFKGDVSKKRLLWFNMREEEQVYTGHNAGKVTINIREADHVEREKARVSFGEAHRTLIGHFRHEMGHYFWDLLVKGKCEQQCIEIFGDHNNPDYSTALETYYEHGPKTDWQFKYISGYATMHPWEDFAECFAVYLDMVSVVDIAFHANNIQSVDALSASLNDISRRYFELGLFMNEMNRAMGLLDRVPQVYNAETLRKIAFIHNMTCYAAHRTNTTAIDQTHTMLFP